MSTSAKRAAAESDSSSDDDFGPAPLADSGAAAEQEVEEKTVKPARKKMRKLEFEQVCKYLHSDGLIRS